MPGCQGTGVETVMSALTPTGYKLLTFRGSCTFLSIIRKNCQLCFCLKPDFACTLSNFCRGGDPIFSNWSLETNQIPNDNGKSATFPLFFNQQKPSLMPWRQANELFGSDDSEFWQAQVRLNTLWCQCCGYGGEEKEGILLTLLSHTFNQEQQQNTLLCSLVAKSMTVRLPGLHFKKCLSSYF